MPSQPFDDVSGLDAGCRQFLWGSLVEIHAKACSTAMSHMACDLEIEGLDGQDQVACRRHRPNKLQQRTERGKVPHDTGFAPSTRHLYPGVPQCPAAPELTPVDCSRRVVHCSVLHVPIMGGEKVRLHNKIANINPALSRDSQFYRFRKIECRLVAGDAPEAAK
jgi:hypothetical protein